MAKQRGKSMKKRRARRGLGSLYRRGAIWWFAFTDADGNRIRESTEATDREEALEKFEKRRAEIRKGGLASVGARKTTFEDASEMLVNDYKVNKRKSLFRAEASLKHLKRFFAGERMSAITRDRLDDYVVLRSEKEKAKPATIKLELAALRRMFSLAEAAGKLVRPAPRFPQLASMRQKVAGLEARFAATR